MKKMLGYNNVTLHFKKCFQNFSLLLNTMNCENFDVNRHLIPILLCSLKIHFVFTIPQSRLGVGVQIAGGTGRGVATLWTIGPLPPAIATLYMY